MKKTRIHKSTWLTLISIVVLSIFVFIGGWCLPDEKVETEKFPNASEGTMRIVKTYPGSAKMKTYDGKWDKVNEKFVGPVTIRFNDVDGDYHHTEKVPMKDGKRNGKGIYIHPNGQEDEVCYQNDVRVNCQKKSGKSAVFSTNDNSAYSIFSYKKPWFAFQLEAFDFDPDYMKAYLDTLELVLYANEFSVEEFDDYYDEVIDVLGETPYDSLIQLNDIFSLENGIDQMSSNEFRLATINSYRDNDGNTYEVVNTVYPNYLLLLNTAEVTDTDFEGFCEVYDSIMVSYDPLDPDDYFFIDSLEERMFRTLDLIYSGNESSESVSQSLKSAWLSDELDILRALQREYLSHYKKQASNKTPPEVAEIVLFSMIMEFIHGDLLKNAVKEAFDLKKGIVQLPTLVTNFSGNTSSTSATIEGNVIEDGGGEVSARGIVWESFYNPSIDNQLITGGTGTGVFTSTITGLSEGETYYARAFATNSAGTAYGNCISFVAGGASGIEARDVDNLDFQIYPNPATDIITLSFEAKDTQGMMFTLYDLSGKIVLQEELENVVHGENTIRIGLPELKSGIYTCSLVGDNKTHAIQKLTITH